MPWGALGQIIGTGANFLYNEYNNQRNWEHQQQINEQNRYNAAQITNMNWEHEYNMWKLNNEYNTPQAQMQRFIDAGLNPHLIYGQTNTAQPIHITPMEKTQYQSQEMQTVDLMNFLSNIISIKGLEIDNQNKQLETEKRELENEYLRRSLDPRLKFLDVKNNRGMLEFNHLHQYYPILRDSLEWKNDINRQILLDWLSFNHVNNRDFSNSLYQYQYDMLKNEWQRNIYNHKYYKYDNWINRVGNTIDIPMRVVSPWIKRRK